MSEQRCPKPLYYNPSTGKRDLPCGRTALPGKVHCRYHDPETVRSRVKKSADTQRLKRSSSAPQPGDEG